MAGAACSTGQPAAPAAPATAPAAAERLEQSFKAVLSDPRHGMSSFSVLAIRGGKVSYEGQFGMRHIDSGNPSLSRAATPATMYRIASISKLVTTMGVMRLVEQGKLHLDEDVGTYIGFSLRNPAFPNTKITLRMLLSHTSSLRDEAGYSWGANVALRDVFHRGGALWATHTVPGAHFAYSNLNWGVVGTLMEAASGERFDRLMRRLVLQPLGLRGGYNVAEFSSADWSDTATLYRKRVGEGAWNPGGPWVAQVDDTSAPAPVVAGLDRYVVGTNGTLFSPTGGLRISAADLGKIMLMFMDQGRHAGAAFLQPASVEAMFSRQWTYDAGNRNGDTHGGLFAAWGLGTQHFEHQAGAKSSLVEGGGFAASGHLGEAYGLLSVFALDFANRNGMVVLIGGTMHDPASTPGQYSALSRQEELLLTPLYENAVLPSQ
ncbi:serine hydrolase [Massilia glaciei]|uniref:Serine hydrolase n=2 Tax=Massilia glaciei TaxID=1524097 RepID=A0A2U2HEU9_9BURK|nr:serine hydrolase [Massilia glaciei]